MKKPGFSVDEVIGVVEKAFCQQDPKTLERLWHADFNAMGADLEHDGDNKSPLPHMEGFNATRCYEPGDVMADGASHRNNYCANAFSSDAVFSLKRYRCIRQGQWSDSHYPWSLKSILA